MATEMSGAGMYVQVSGLHGVASRLDDTAGVLHGHADAIAGVSIPMAAFGANTAAGAEHEQSRQTLSGAIRSHAERVTGHGAHVRTAAGSQVANDNSGGATVGGVGGSV